jgi:putative membrane protein
MKFIIRWLISALLLLLIAYLLQGIKVANLYIALLAAAFLGLVNALIRPIIILITLPINLLTLGLFTLVINALLFWFVASFLEGFSITGFWPAFWGSLILSIGSWLANKFIVSK